ncbi:MAG: ATP-dependent DNA helicase [Gammaproteobacteria bacterium WSBS_2016_MAG_OTU1]
MIDDLFDEGGPLAQNIDGYRLRQGQVDMAKTIAGNHGLQVLEAGTGIGKTFAYLAPIIQLRLSAIISTGTRALQSQLFERDIPFLTAALKRPVQVTMLKGRANYICRRNIDNPTQSQLFEDDNGDWAKIVLFANKSEDGDISTATDISANSPAWAAAVSTRETCTVQKCKFYENCFLYRARARAHQSDIVVVNHHLFLADMRLREEELAELLPKRDIVVFDEAHILPSLDFGESLSIAEMLRILATIDRKSQSGEIPTTITAMAQQWRAAIGALIDSSKEFLSNEFSTTTIAAQKALDKKEWRKNVENLHKTLNEMRDVAISEMNLDPTIQDKQEWVSTIAAEIAATSHKLQRWLNLANNIDDDANEYNIDDEPKIPLVCWLQIGKRRGALTLHSAPVSGRKIFRHAWKNSKNVIMTSATLTIDNEFKNFVQETGMEDAHAESWASPFDYANRSMLYLPPNMPPNPNDKDYTEAVIRSVVPLVRANRGHAFILFSSLRAMRKGAELLTAQLGEEYQILMQGDACPTMYY